MTEDLQCVALCTKLWGYSRNQSDTNSCRPGTYDLMEEGTCSVLYHFHLYQYSGPDYAIE